MKYRGKKYQKIMVVGSPGSGKSYLAKEIHKKTGMHLVHLDNEYWNPDWLETEKEEWIDKQKKLMEMDCWIIDGNYNSTMELRVGEADFIIFLDVKRMTCIYGVLRRHGKKRSDLPEYLEERFDWEFLKFIHFVWSFPKKQRGQILEQHRQYPEKNLWY